MTKYKYVLTIQKRCRIDVKTQTRHTHICLTLSLFLNNCSNNSCAHAVLTLNDVGDHEGGAGVITNETTTSQVVFNLQGK